MRELIGAGFSLVPGARTRIDGPPTAKKKEKRKKNTEPGLIH
jgi:hypothetical protein